GPRRSREALAVELLGEGFADQAEGDDRKVSEGLEPLPRPPLSGNERQHQEHRDETQLDRYARVIVSPFQERSHHDDNAQADRQEGEPEGDSDNLESDGHEDWPKQAQDRNAERQPAKGDDHGAERDEDDVLDVPVHALGDVGQREPLVNGGRRGERGELPDDDDKRNEQEYGEEPAPGARGSGRQASGTGV